MFAGIAVYPINDLIVSWRLTYLLPVSLGLQKFVARFLIDRLYFSLLIFSPIIVGLSLARFKEDKWVSEIH